MKYTIEQKERLKGMDNFNIFQCSLAKSFSVPPNRIRIKGDFIVIDSKINYKKI
jgi:hypothetical protein